MTKNSSEKPKNKQGNRRGMHPNSLANLKNGKRFGAGQKGNPNGRPKNELSLTNALRHQLDEICPYDQRGRTWRDYLVDRWLANAASNPSYFTQLIERLEGKVVQPVGGEGGKPIPISVVEIHKDYGG